MSVATGTQTATVLVTDLVGSTELRVQLGEERADQFRRRHDGLLTAAVDDHGGSVVKGLGDGILAIFGSAADAIGAAVAMQQAVDAEWGHTPVPAAIRVGLSVGDVSLENGDSFGNYGIEINQLTAASPPGTAVLAQIKDTFGPGKSAEMTYYTTTGGAKVFSAGAINFGGSAQLPVVSLLLTNLWRHLRRP